MKAVKEEPLDRIEARLVTILLVAAGLDPEYVSKHLPRFTKYLSGEVPTTVIRLGHLEWPYPPNPNDHIVAELVFRGTPKSVAWWLLRGENDDAEIEILVSGNTEPWTDIFFPNHFEVAVKPRVRD